MTNPQQAETTALRASTKIQACPNNLPWAVSARCHLGHGLVSPGGEILRGRAADQGLSTASATCHSPAPPGTFHQCKWICHRHFPTVTKPNAKRSSLRLCPLLFSPCVPRGHRAVLKALRGVSELGAGFRGPKAACFCPGFCTFVPAGSWGAEGGRDPPAPAASSRPAPGGKSG